jgi:HTH-type transcriptional regulator / antitoxin HipB
MHEQPIETPAELGELVRTRRKALEITQGELAGLSGVGVRFIVELEHGKPTLELGRVLRVLNRLKVQLFVRHDDEST